MLYPVPGIPCKHGIKGLNIESYPAYMLYVRGNRLIKKILARVQRRCGLQAPLSKEQLITVPGSNTQAYTLVGNPYASPIDFEKI